MSSEARSETESEGGGGHERKSKRVRRRRGNRRFKPYGLVEDGETLECDEKAPKKSRRTLERLGMAPSNTTQFLLEDREARAEAEHESEQKYEAAERRRIRSISCGSGDGVANCSTCLAGSEEGSSSGEESEADKEFDRNYLLTKRDFIEKMSKPELEQELLAAASDQTALQHQCGKFRSENLHLKELLAANGIPYKKVSVEYPTSTTSSFEHPNHSLSPKYESKSPTISAN